MELQNFTTIKWVCYLWTVPYRYKKMLERERLFTEAGLLDEYNMPTCEVFSALGENQAQILFDGYCANTGMDSSILLFDMDILDCNGQGLHGTEFGRGQRKCIICGEPVWECSRSRAHCAEQLATRTAGIFDDYFSQQYADKIGGMAVRALLYEVNVTPKPGLVDRANNGAHRDMDIFTFLDSSCALIPYFRDITLQGLRFKGKPGKLLCTLRYAGQCAEDTMFFATKRINTHKGLIFSLGLICAAMGYMYGKDQPQTVDMLLKLCARIAGDTPEELTTETTLTYGELAYKQYGLTGIRGEVAAGFPNVRDYGYPVLKTMVEHGYSLNNAGVIALLHLLVHVTDTNMINRSDLGTLHAVQAQVVQLLTRTSELEELLQIARELDRQFIVRNLSPGGCADLLAVSMMLFFVEQEVF